ncbi:ABC-2 transporter permease [Viridibacillus soli]|uniref:ABC-2 transporter permease n=1 Tax=Viridibacillus soli TaxID=2798301 RepID=UPI00190D520D|nr:ABC-2 transporter permease [Viridibacillus soli]
MAKDWYINRKYWWFIVAAFLVIMIIGSLEEGPLAISVFGLPLMSIYFILIIFSLDEKSNWQKFANTFPISRKIYVKSRYIIAFWIITAVHISTFLLAFILNMWSGEISTF